MLQLIPATADDRALLFNINQNNVLVSGLKNEYSAAFILGFYR